MDASHRGDGADLKEVWPSPGGHVCISKDLTMSLLVLSNSSSSIGAGCHGTDVTEASSSWWGNRQLLPVNCLVG